jgi:hypothetical protein
MIIICLDQCAISELAKADDRKTSLGQLREALITGCEDLKILCPVAKETIVETTGMRSAERRIQIYDLHSRLADAQLGGPLWAFKDMWKLIDEETLALARSQRPPSAFEMFNWRRIDDDELAAETWEGIVEGKKQMFDRVQSHPLVQIEGRPTLKTTGDGIILEHAGHVYRQVKRLIANEDLDPKDHMGYGLAEYLKEQRVTRDQLEKLIQDILYHRWEAIPVIYGRTQITGQLELDYRNIKNPRRYDVNDEFDIPRVAVGLASAHIIITDAAMAQLCHNAKTIVWSGVKVFAIRDPEKILAHLKSVGAAE